MIRLALAAFVIAGGAAAETRTLPADFAGHADLISHLAHQGCTLGPSSDDRLDEAGFAPGSVADLAYSALAAGLAAREGDYTVLGPELCTIRLPRIESRWTVADAAIRNDAPFMRVEDGATGATGLMEGCFLADPLALMTDMNAGDAEAGFRDYIDLIAAGIIAGEIRFYSDDPFRTPPGFQIMDGDCAEIANLDQITGTHSTLASGFDAWIRAAGAYNRCGEEAFSWPPGLDAALQGFNPDVPVEEQPPMNAFMAMEWMMITMAAGWHEGMSLMERGHPRPPLCTFGD